MAKLGRNSISASSVLTICLVFEIVSYRFMFATRKWAANHDIVRRYAGSSIWLAEQLAVSRASGWLANGQCRLDLSSGVTRKSTASFGEMDFLWFLKAFERGLGGFFFDINPSSRTSSSFIFFAMQIKNGL